MIGAGLKKKPFLKLDRIQKTLIKVKPSRLFVKLEEEERGEEKEGEGMVERLRSGGEFPKTNERNQARESK